MGAVGAIAGAAGTAVTGVTGAEGAVLAGAGTSTYWVARLAVSGMTAGKVVDIAKAEQMVVVTTIPRGYRDWKFVSAAHEAGELNDIRVVVANDKAISAYRAAKPFPEGSVIGRVAWKMVPSEENNKTFAQPQSFVPGEAPDWYLQFMLQPALARRSCCRSLT